MIDNCDVQGLAVDKEWIRVIGARIIRRQSASAEEILPADLVVDASGRGSRTPAWLEALGYPKPAVELVEVGMGYATRLYRRQPEHLGGDLFVNVAPTRENKRACGMLAQEGERWIVTLAGYFGDSPAHRQARLSGIRQELARTRRIRGYPHCNATERANTIQVPGQPAPAL